MSPLKLTPWGEFVRLHSVMTPPDWWQKLRREVERAQDEDGEWEMLLDERIRGLTQLREDWYRKTAP